MSAKKKTKASKEITTYKGFDKDFQCRGFQYEIGKTYEHDGEVVACKSGFHACEYPLDVFSYYPPATSKFAVVKQFGSLSHDSDDSKVASRSISISAEIDIAGLVEAAIAYTTSRCKPIDPESPAFASGSQGAATASGYQGAATASGKYSIASATGKNGRAKAFDGGAIVLVFRGDDGVILHIKASKVGENGIKPGVWYELNSNGDFVEVET